MDNLKYLSRPELTALLGVAEGESHLKAREINELFELLGKVLEINSIVVDYHCDRLHIIAN